ncbi:hypothetical protein AB0K89_28410 [Streptomyces cinnamoneus]|uniref:hypothetical protein n=1 Tax=Streptomyces cinnamoneus TaxID=53446 RepID=UPI00341CC638
MNDAVGSEELLGRIRRARDWAATEDERLLSASRAAEEGSSQATAYAIEARMFNAIKAVLDEIIEPGTHAGSS